MELLNIVRKIKNNLEFELPKKNAKVYLYQQWYKGFVDDFHKMIRYNGNQQIESFKLGLGMAKTVCEDWASLLANEKTQIVLEDEKQNALLDKILKKNNFNVILNDCVEKSFALGKGCLVLSIENLNVGVDSGKIFKSPNAKINIDFVDANKITPITFNNKRITECAFEIINSDSVVYILHMLNEYGNYVIHNYEYSNKGILIRETIFDTKSPNPLYFVIRPNINNNSFFYDDLGISIFANAIDQLKTCDDIFDAFRQEFVLGRMKTYVSAALWRIEVGKNGEMIKTFDNFTDQYYILPETQGTREDKPMIQVECPPLRYDAYESGLTRALNLLGSKCGFGLNRFKIENGGLMTATQVVSENSELFRNLKKHARLLEQALIDMTNSIVYLNDTFLSEEKFGDVDYSNITVLFDDSIIEDKKSEKEQARLDVQSGIMSKQEYRIKYYGESEEEANEKVREYYLFTLLNDYQMSLQAGTITPKEFVLKVYGREDKELEEYIKTMLETSRVDFNDFMSEEIK